MGICRLSDQPDEEGGTYPVYDLFSTIQGEATWTGRAMLFLRFSGCPLSCSWCDEPRHRDSSLTQHWTAQHILAKLRHVEPNLRSLVLTGGEPLAVVAIAGLIGFLQKQGYWVAMETSGVGGLIPASLDWVTLSPKRPLPEAIFAKADEIKYIVGAAPTVQQGEEIQFRATTHANVWVQPKSSDVGSDNYAALQHCLHHISLSSGKIRLSLQTHKLVGLP